MGEGTGSLLLQWVDRIEQIPQGAWDTLALPLATPFLEWHWLRNLENSGSAIPQAGWLPRHLTVWRQGTLIAAAPLYIKGHSQGEFVFDHQWADLSQRLGIRYYPKLLGMTPFTPAQGYRFLIAPGEDEASLTAAMLAEIDRFAQANHFSGCNFLFVDPDWQPLVEACGYRAWLHHSYVWQNRNYTTFDDYLGAFNANQRRNIKRERKAVSHAGLEMVVHTGEDVSRTLLSRMYHFYGDTCDKFGWWGSKYLTKAFFEQLHRDFQQRVVLVTAYREGDRAQPIGMSFCIRKAENLYGRYWGSLEEIDCLHFEACYYQPIDWAISERIQMFDPGAGGRHKKRRGFPATPNYSLHRFYTPRLSQILDHYIAEINQQEQAIIDEVNQDLPFKA